MMPKPKEICPPQRGQKISIIYLELFCIRDLALFSHCKSSHSKSGSVCLAIMAYNIIFCDL